MLKITNEEIKNLKLSCSKMLGWVDETLRHKKEMILPSKTSMKMNDGLVFYNVMPCIIPNEGVAGVKIVTRYPDRIPALDSNLMLYDLKDGYLKAMIDADFITTWRTAAVAVHSIKLFAKNNYKVVSFIGLGVIGKATLRMFIDTLDKDRDVEIRIFNFDNTASSIIKEFDEGKPNIKFSSYDNYDEMVSSSDVVVSAVTYAEKDFTSEDMYPKGILLVPIHTRGFTECDLTFDKIFGDDINHVSGFKYFKSYKSFNEVNEVLLNECTGRDNDEQRIIAYNIGIALHDITFAKKIYDLVVEENNMK